MGVAGLAMLAFWGALIVGGLLLVRWLITPSHAPSSPGGDDALALLRRRYAAGEIDQATYQRMRRDLTSTAPPASDLTSDTRTADGQGEERPVLTSRGRPESPSP
jgi:putative membrane protein